MPRKKTPAPTPPRFIVGFQDRMTDGMDVLSDALDWAPVEKAGGPGYEHAMRFEGRMEKENEEKVFHSLGLAAMDLTEEDCMRLRRRDEVAFVVANEQRSALGSSNRPQLPPRRGRPSLPPRRGRPPLRSRGSAAFATAPSHDEKVRAESPAAEASGAAFQTLSGASHSWCLEMLGIDPFYQASRGKGIKVAVLDTGVDLGHPDIKGRVSKSKSFVPGESVQDANGHGTHCAGIVAGPQAFAATGGIRYGVAPEARLLVGKVLSNSGLGWDSEILDGIAWAVAEGAQVISMSLGSARRTGEPFAPHYERIASMLLEANPGTLIISAAGNESMRPHYLEPVGNPGACPSIMAVGAVGSDERVADFTSAQLDSIGYVDVSAPGVGVLSAVPGGRAHWDGTSMATPHVAGLAALHLELRPNLSANSLWSMIAGTVRSMGPSTEYGAGIAVAPLA